MRTARQVLDVPQRVPVRPRSADRIAPPSRCQVDVHPCPRLRIRRRVGPGPPVQVFEPGNPSLNGRRVSCPRPADQGVVPGPALEPVSAGPAVKIVVAGLAEERVVPVPAEEPVVPGPAEEIVVPVPAVKIVVAGPAVEIVDAVPAEELVVPVPADQDAIPVPAVKPIIPRISNQKYHSVLLPFSFDLRAEVFTYVLLRGFRLCMNRDGTG